MAKELASWQTALAKDAEKTAKAESSDSNFISLKGGRMTYQDQIIPDDKIECVIVAFGTERTFYDRAYDPDDKNAPDCFAQGLEKGGLIPHANVPNPRAQKCEGCPLAEFGTAKVGKGPACKTRRKLMLMPVSGLDDPAGADLALIALPPTSVKNFSAYASQVSLSSGLPLWAVTTTVAVKPHPKNQYAVVFSAGEKLSGDKTLSAIHALIENAEKELLKPYTYEEEEQEKVALKGQG